MLRNRSAGGGFGVIGCPCRHPALHSARLEASENRTPHTRTTLPEPPRSASLRDTSLRSGRLTHQRLGGFGGAEPHFKYGFEETLIASCVHCEDSRSLRYDQAEQAWVCFDGCGNLPQSKPVSPPKPKRLPWKRSPLFEPIVMVDGVRRKLRHTELREAYRLWATHKDIREGRFRG